MAAESNSHEDLRADRIDEISEILAIGLMRLRARQSSELSPHDGESSLDCAARQSGPADVLKSEGGPN
jgi:hypothetical protein